MAIDTQEAFLKVRKIPSNYSIIRNYNMKDKMCVYCIRNTINNKCYIGITSQTMKDRSVAHFYKLRSNKHDNEYLQNSYNKYGEESFELLTLYKDAPSIDVLKQLEVFYCDIYNSHDKNFGYNLGAVGVGNLKIISDETRRKMTIANNVNWNDDRRKKYSERMTTNGTFKGKKHSVESKKIISEKAKERIKERGDLRFHFKNTTPESKERGRLKRIGLFTGNKNPASQQIIAYNPLTYKEHLFSTVKECAEYFNIASSSIERRIKRVYKGGYNTPNKLIGLNFKRI